MSLAHRFDPDIGWGNLQATVFERESYLGGRAATTMSYDNYLNEGNVVYIGGEIFDMNDRIVQDHARRVGMSLFETSHSIWEDKLRSHVSVWDGELEEMQTNGFDLKHSFNPKISHMVMHHGLSPKFWKILLQEAWNYDTDDYFDSISSWQRLKRSLSRRLDWSHVGPDQTELERLSDDLGMQIASPGLKVGGGNDMFLHRMLRMSGSTLRLNSTVTRIKRYADLTFDVHWEYKNVNGSVKENMDRFDAVIIAAPFHKSNIDIDPPLQVPPEEVLYRPIHVTNVASRRELDPESFNLKTDEQVPSLIWASTGIPQSSSKTSLPPFLSIQKRYLRRLDGCLAETENLYQIVSAQPLSDNDIAKLFKKDGMARKSVTFPDQSCDYLVQSQGFGSESPERREEFAEKYELWDAEREAAWACEEECGPIRDYDEWREEYVGCQHHPDVRWIHRHSWNHGLPIVDSNRSESPIELVPRLFYTNGFEGRDGASLSGSLRQANEVIKTLSAEYCAGCLGYIYYY